MNLSHLFTVFSRRNSAVSSTRAVPELLTPEFRNRVLMRCHDTFTTTRFGDFWSDIHRQLTYLYGRPRLADQQAPNVKADVLAFLASCADEHFLDFVELMFETADSYLGREEQRSLVQDMNQFLLVDGLPYAVTDYIRPTVTERNRSGHVRVLSTKVTAYPQVIRKDSQLVHSHVVSPALNLLADSAFDSANKEFLEALEDYRKSDFGDCLTKCGSAFESTLKIICSRNKWPYNQTDTAAPLLNAVFSNSTKLEPYLKAPLLIVATLRNRLSKSHGSGIEPRHVPPEKAQYAINATAAAILLLVKTYT